MFHYVYKITNLLNNKIYIGKHSTNDLNDGYMGSGFAIKDAIKKHGIENFSKEILMFFDTSKEALEFEKLIVDRQFVDSRNTYNLKEGGTGGYLSKETKEKISNACKGRLSWNKGKTNIYTDETLKKMGMQNKGKTAWNKGVQMTDEQKAKISASKKGKPIGVGHIVSEETKKKISEANKGKIPWNKGKHKNDTKI